MTIVNSIKAVKYEYVTIDFYPIEYREGNGVFGNLQEVSCGVMPVCME